MRSSDSPSDARAGELAETVPAVEPAPFASQLTPGQIVAERYTLERRIGEGGMGVVWAALDRESGERIALKFLKRIGETDRRRMVREARALSAIQHDNVVAVHGVLELDDGTPVMVMELLEGESLAERIDRDGALPLAEVAGIALLVASALARAHEAGIVHRDLKPENIFLSKGDDSVKVLDFGVAKLIGDHGLSASTTLTATGALIGTPCYMSPEQAFGAQRIDHRSDIWALGLVLYECLSGVLPTAADNVGQVFRLILERSFEPLAQLTPQVPRELSDLVGRMLRRDAELRPSMREVMERLAVVADGTVDLPPSASTGQTIRYCATPDGARLAYASTGNGHPLVRVGNWLTHIEYEWNNPVWHPLLQGLSRGHRLVRYDSRGMGLSDPLSGEPSVDMWVSDLATVVDELRLERFALLGISQGGVVASAYAARHPERVSHLILLNAFMRFPFRMPPDVLSSMMTLMRQGWGSGNPAFRQLFTSMFLPEATSEQMRLFDELQHNSCSAEVAAEHLRAFARLDVTDIAPSITVPTLILHRRGDQFVPLRAAQKSASLIPHARFIPLDGANHLYLEGESGFEAVLETIEKFVRS